MVYGFNNQIIFLFVYLRFLNNKTTYGWGIGTKFYLKCLTLEYCVDSINQHHKGGCYDNDIRLWPYTKNVIKNLLAPLHWK